MEQREAIEYIAEHYGYDAQSRQLIEEMSELTKAINKFWRKQLCCGRRELMDNGAKAFTSQEYSNIVEELADVSIMLQQVMYLLHCEATVDIVMQDKLERILAVIAEDLASRKDV